MLLLLAACQLGDTGPSEREVCDARKREAVQAWQDVADYFDRVAAMQEDDVLAAEMDAEEARHRREAAVGIRDSWQRKKTTGLVDARTGEERKDPDAERAAEARRQQAAWHVEARTDEEAEVLATAMELRASYDGVIAQGDQARGVVSALETQPLNQAWQASLQGAEELGDTELSAMVRVATDEAKAACDGVP